MLLCLQNRGCVQLDSRRGDSRPTASKIVRFRGQVRGGKPVKPTASTGLMERAMGIEPTSEAWEARNKTLKVIDLAALSFLSDGLNWKLDGNRNGYHSQIQSVPFCR